MGRLLLLGLVWFACACSDAGPGEGGPERAADAKEPAGAGHRDPAALHLFDVAPAAVEVSLDWLPEDLRELLSQPEAILVEEIPRGAFRPQRVDGTPTWLASTRFAILGEPRRLRIEESAEPGAGELTKRELARRPGWMVVGPKGVSIALKEGERVPEKLLVSYTTRPRALLSEMVGPQPTPGALPLNPLVQMGVDARRAALVGAPSRLVWKVRVPRDGHLDVAHAGNRLALEVRDGAVRVWKRSVGRTRFAVEVHAGDAEPAVLYDLTTGPLHGFQDRRVDLSRFAGREVELHLVAESLPDKEGRVSFPMWSEPVLVDPHAVRACSVLVVMLDTLRADRLGCYGWERAHTPHLDELAGRGVRFERAFSGAPWTLPSHSTLFTSLHVSQHGIWDRKQRLSEDALTLAEVMRGAGYRTGAVAEGGFVHPQYGLAQGFERFLTQEGKAGYKDARLTFTNMADWMDAVDGPFFAFVHTYLVHSPYDPPEPWRSKLVRPYDGELGAGVSPLDYPWGNFTEETLSEEGARYVSDLYDAEIAYLDDEFGRFMATLQERGLLEDTLVIVTSDHGDEFGEHGHFEHGHSIYEEQLHVPLILWHPRTFTGGVTASHAVAFVDLAPTVAALTGAEIPSQWVGRPLSLEPPEVAEPLFTPFFTKASGLPAAVLRVGAMKYIDYPASNRPADPHPSHMLFDLGADPGETRNLLDETEQERWSTAVEQQWSRFGPALEVESSTVSPAVMADLKALGYVDDG